MSFKEFRASSQGTLTFLAIEVARLLRQQFEQATRDAQLEITPGEARVLMYINRYPRQRQAALAGIMSLQPMTLSGFLDRLEERGLIQRSVDPVDRRARVINLSPKADAVIDRIDEIGDRLRKAATAGLDRMQVSELRAALIALRDGLASEDPLPSKKEA